MPKVKYVRTALSPEVHGELKKQCAINNISMQDFVADLIASNLEGEDPLARALSERSKDEVLKLLDKAREMRGN